jgi:cytochrome b involved in lipid metabolism
MLQPEIAGEEISISSSKGWSKLAGWVSLFTSKYAKPMATATGGVVKAPVLRRAPRVKPGELNVPVFTYAEVAQHSTPDDAWVVIEGSVYEISNMAHPGGEVLFSYAGRDATEPFQALHKNQVRPYGAAP